MVTAPGICVRFGARRSNRLPPGSCLAAAGRKGRRTFRRTVRLRPDLSPTVKVGPALAGGVRVVLQRLLVGLERLRDPALLFHENFRIRF